MDWTEYDFILAQLDDQHAALDAKVMLTGWETVVFELEDDEPVEE